MDWEVYRTDYGYRVVLCGRNRDLAELHGRRMPPLRVRMLLVQTWHRRWPLARAYLDAWSYILRPYDMVADRRRWRWQRAAPCGRAVWAALPPADRAEIERAVAERAGYSSPEEPA